MIYYVLYNVLYTPGCCGLWLRHAMGLAMRSVYACACVSYIIQGNLRLRITLCVMLYFVRFRDVRRALSWYIL